MLSSLNERLLIFVFRLKFFLFRDITDVANDHKSAILSLKVYLLNQNLDQYIAFVDGLGRVARHFISVLSFILLLYFLFFLFDLAYKALYIFGSFALQHCFHNFVKASTSPFFSQ